MASLVASGVRLLARRNAGLRNSLEQLRSARVALAARPGCEQRMLHCSARIALVNAPQVNQRRRRGRRRARRRASALESSPTE